MNPAGVNKAARRIVFAVHLWGGLSVGLFLSLMGLTGALLMFLEPVSRLNDPMQAMPAAPQSSPASLDRAWAGIHARYPDEKLQRVYFPDAPGQSLTFLTARGAWGPGAMLKEFSVHPATGALLAPPHPRYGAFYNFVFYFHMDLLAVGWRETAKMLSGWGAVLSLALIASGVYLWWPARGKSGRGRMALPRRGKRLLHDLHNLAGLAGAAGLTLLCLTGLSYQWKEPVQTAVYALTGTPVGRTKNPKVAKNAQFTVGLDQVRAQADLTLPRVPVSQIQVPLKPGDSVRVSKTYPERDDRGGESVFVYLHPTTGAVLRVEDNLPRNRAEAVLRWMQPLHFGTWAARFGNGAQNTVRVVYALVGLSPLFLLVTGAAQYGRLRRAKQANRKRRADAPASFAPLTGIAP